MCGTWTNFLKNVSALFQGVGKREGFFSDPFRWDKGRKPFTPCHLSQEPDKANPPCKGHKRPKPAAPIGVVDPFFRLA